MAVLHQTRNGHALVSGGVLDAKRSNAIKLTAKIDVIAVSADEIKDKFMFHLLNLAWKPVDVALYAGKKPSEGSMKLDFVAPPFWPTGSPILLDTQEEGAGPFPYFETKDADIRRTADPAVWTVFLEAYDHPFADRPLALPNFATSTRRDDPGKLNYLYEVTRTVNFLTSIVVRDLGNSDLKPLGFIGWRSVLKAQIPWRDTQDGERPSDATFIRSFFTSDGFSRGLPNEEAGKKMTDPLDQGPDTYNAREKDNLRNVIGSVSNSPAVQASKTRTTPVPATHFGP